LHTPEGLRVKGLICLEGLYETVARATVGDTPVQFVITTNELDYMGVVPPLLAMSRKQRFAGTLDMLDLLSRFDGAELEFATFTRRMSLFSRILRARPGNRKEL